MSDDAGIIPGVAEAAANDATVATTDNVGEVDVQARVAELVAQYSDDPETLAAHIAALVTPTRGPDDETKREMQLASARRKVEKARAHLADAEAHLAELEG